MWRILILVAILSLGAMALSGCNFLKPSPDAVALTAVKEALSGQPGWQADDLIIEVESLRCTVGGELGSQVIFGNLSDALQKLVDEGVITSFENNCEVLDETNPLMQDFTAPTLAF